jgi:hypothetical protein
MQQCQADSQAPVSHLVGLECQASTGTGQALCCLDCRIEPYLIKAAPLRGTASGAPRAGLWPWKAPPGAPAPSEHAMPQIHNFNSARLLVCTGAVFRSIVQLPAAAPRPPVSVAARSASPGLGPQPLTRIWHLRKDGQLGRVCVASQFAVRGDCCLPISATAAYIAR